MKLNVVNPVPEDALAVAFGYKNIHFYEEHVKNGGVASRFGIELLERGYKGHYTCHCVPNYTIKQATVEQLWQLCELDSNSIIKDFKGE